MRLLEQIRTEVLRWPGVYARPNQGGGLKFMYGQRQLGHLHDDAVADLPFPLRERDALIASGRVEPHPQLPQSGWVTHRLRCSEDLNRVLELFRQSYERAVARRGIPQTIAMRR